MERKDGEQEKAGKSRAFIARKWGSNKTYRLVSSRLIHSQEESMGDASKYSLFMGFSIGIQLHNALLSVYPYGTERTHAKSLWLFMIR